jgi:APA family basic amino acid/polyamine antiporter
MAELKRTLNTAEVVFFASGVILGAGIYTVVGEGAGLGGNMLWLAFLISSVAALLTVFGYAELSSIYPKAGGEFVYTKEIFGLKPAYFVGVMVALCGIVSSATISLGFAGYLAELVNFHKFAFAFGIIGLIFLVNVLGIRHSSVVNIIFTIIECGGLLFVIFSAAPSFGKISYTELPPDGIHGVLAAAALSFFAFTGFEDTVKLAEETKEPERSIPKALFISSAIVMCLYMCVAILAVSAVPFEELGQSESPLATIIEKRFGHTGALVLAVVALFSTSNSLLSNMLGASRVIYTIGKESKALKLFSKVSSKRKTPVPALLLVTLIIAAFSLIGEVKSVALITNIFVFTVYIIINVCVIYLRIKDKDLERPFKVPFNIKNIPVLNVIAILMISVLMVYGVKTLINSM